MINTGNANAGTGADGLQRARSTCRAVASRLGLRAQEVWPFSTGVIMEPLPVERIVAGLDAAIAAAREDRWFDAALGIMTTDTVPKAFGARAPDWREDRHDHRHQQGCRHDPAEHGHDARIHRDGCLRRSLRDAAALP